MLSEVKMLTAQKRQALIESRQALRLTRTELATLVGVSFEHIKSLEYGRVNPSIHLMYKLCKELNSTPEELFKDIICV